MLSSKNIHIFCRKKTIFNAILKFTIYDNDLTLSFICLLDLYNFIMWKYTQQEYTREICTKIYETQRRSCYIMYNHLTYLVVIRNFELIISLYNATSGKFTLT